MKYIKTEKMISGCALAVMLLLTGCGGSKPDLPYGSLDGNSNFSIDTQTEAGKLPFFAEELCATAEDITDSASVDTSELKAACVYNVSERKVVYSYKANDRLYPASLTKIMTALIVLENCQDLSEEVIVGDVNIREQGVQLFGLKEGDSLTVSQLLYATLVNSSNDAALALAIRFGDNVEHFVDMMNTRALQLGCTHTHFVNPHGLPNEDHYTSAYDLYLMFNEALKHEEFVRMIQTVKYTVDYRNAEGEPQSKDITSTNSYLTGAYKKPGEVTVIGGKTGSTASAGRCMILSVDSAAGDPYIIVVMGAGDNDVLYGTISKLCNECVK
ncbi:MAG: serine hydrolase [Lachnospiraceae bacterium]|nr:serine hydrolase [Lachnospiraceae bacterium]